MPLYISLAKLTEQGAKGVGELPSRWRRAIADAERRGFKNHGLYFTMGPYDVVIVTEAPDDETMMRTLVNMYGHGNLQTVTLKAFSLEEFERLTRSDA
jgi:uncharacterized protein with GYD domain